MANIWVYRRPHFPAWKPKIPLTRPGQPVRPRRRRYWRSARRHIVHTRLVVVMGVAAQQTAGKVVIRLRPKHRIIQPRPQAAHNKIPLSRFDGRISPVVRYRKAQTARRVVKALRTLVPPGGRFEGKQGPIRRLLKAIQRMREGMQRRLLFRPREIPPIIPQEVIHAIARGEIVTAGAVEADVATARAVRGDVW